MIANDNNGRVFSRSPLNFVLNKATFQKLKQMTAKGKGFLILHQQRTNKTKRGHSKVATKQKTNER